MIPQSILIICPSMWPNMRSWGETQRMYYLANFLSEQGHRVYTVSPAYTSDKEKHPRKQLYTSFFMGSFPGGETQGTSTATLRRARRIRRLFSRTLTPFVNWFLNEPNCWEGIRKQRWTIQYQNEISRLIEEKEITKVIISVPPFSLMSLGPVLKSKFPSLQIIYDYRDPWFLWNQRKGPAYYVERRYLSYADIVIGFSDVFCQDLIQKLRIPPDKVHAVYNGYSDQDWKHFESSCSAKVTQHNKLRFVYAGTMFLTDTKENYRNPNRLIEAVRQCDDAELFLVGVCGIEEDQQEGNIHYLRNVSQESSFQWMCAGDVLISIHDADNCSGRYLISGKYYDYMRSGRVIRHIGASQDLMSRMTIDMELGVVCDNADASISKTLVSLISHWHDGTISTLRNCTSDKLTVYSRESQNKRYTEIIEQQEDKK